MNLKYAALVACSVSLVPNIASAYYAAHMGRWTSRDPSGTHGKLGRDIMSGLESSGRFVARDALSPTISDHRIIAVGYLDGFNLYEYIHSTPPKGSDPSGLFSWPWPGNGQFCNNSKGCVMVWAGIDKGDDNFQILPPGGCTSYWKDHGDSVFDSYNGCWKKIPGGTTCQFNSDSQVGYYGCCRKSESETGAEPWRPIDCHKDENGNPKKRRPPRDKCEEYCNCNKALGTACVEYCMSQ